MSRVTGVEGSEQLETFVNRLASHSSNRSVLFDVPRQGEVVFVPIGHNLKLELRDREGGIFETAYLGREGAEELLNELISAVLKIRNYES